MSAWVITIVFLVLYFGAAIWYLRGKKLRLGVQELCVCGIMTAMTLVLEMIRIPLPTGATMPLGSPIPLLLLAVLWDGRLAVLSGWVCAVLAIFLIPGWQPVHPMQILIEHMVCFSCLGFAGIFGTDRRWKVFCGILLASALKLCGHLFSGVLFFSQNAWEGWGAWGYSLGYNISQNVPLCIVSGIVVMALPLKALQRAVRKEAAA